MQRAASTWSWNSERNFFVNDCTGHAAASPRAQIVLPSMSDNSKRIERCGQRQQHSRRDRKMAYTPPHIAPARHGLPLGTHGFAHQALIDNWRRQPGRGLLQQHLNRIIGARRQLLSNITHEFTTVFDCAARAPVIVE